MKDVAKVEQFGVQPEKIWIEVRKSAWRSWGWIRPACCSSWAARTRWRAPAPYRRRRTWCRCAWPGSSPAWSSCAPCRFAHPSPRPSCAWATLPRCTAAVDPPDVKVRFQGQEVIALGISMTKGGDIIALGRRCRAAVADIEQRLPAGVELAKVQDQPAAVAASVNEFIKVLIEAVVIVLAVSFLVAWGCTRAGALAGRRWTGGPGWWWPSPSRWCWRHFWPCITSALGCTRCRWARSSSPWG